MGCGVYEFRRLPMFKKIIAAVRGVFTPAKPASKKNPASATKTKRKSATAENPRRARGEKTRNSAGATGPRKSGGESRDNRRSDPKGRARSERSGQKAASPKKRIADDFEHPRREPIKPAVPVDVPKMDTAFSALGLCDALAYAVQEKGYTEPTPIQAQSIPVILEGRDLIGSAQTGT